MNLRNATRRGRGLAALVLCILCVGAAPATSGIDKATLEEPGQRTSEISTDEMRRILREGSATVLDVRPQAEYARGHIPGARNVAPKPGVEPSGTFSDVAEVARLVQEDKKTPVVLYGNGPFCMKSKRLAEELLAAGHKDVRRYQLGIPVWRALGEICAVDFEGFRTLVERDRTAVIIDAREAKEFALGALPGARNIPRSRVVEERDAGEVRSAKEDGRLPMEDHGTRIFVLGEDGPGARFVAGALAREGFYNVAYFEGAFAQTGAAPER